MTESSSSESKVCELAGPYSADDTRLELFEPPFLSADVSDGGADSVKDGALPSEDSTLEADAATELALRGA